MLPIDINKFVRINGKLKLDENLLNQQLETYEILRQEWISQVWEERNRMLTNSKKKKSKSKKQTLDENYERHHVKKRTKGPASKADKYKSAYTGKKKKVKINDRVDDFKRNNAEEKIPNTSSDDRSDKDWVFIENHNEAESVEKAVAELNDDSVKRLKSSNKKSPKSLVVQISSSNFSKSVTRICEEYGLLGILTSFISYLYMEDRFFENRELRRIIGKGLCQTGNLDALLKKSKTLDGQNVVNMNMANFSDNEVIVYRNEASADKQKIFSLSHGQVQTFDTYATQAFLLSLSKTPDSGDPNIAVYVPPGS